MTYVSFAVVIMNNTSISREKRDRDSPGVTSPLCKQSKMTGSESEDASPSQSVEKYRLDKMMELLTSLKKRPRKSAESVRQ